MIDESFFFFIRIQLTLRIICISYFIIQDYNFNGNLIIVKFISFGKGGIVLHLKWVRFRSIDLDCSFRKEVFSHHDGVLLTTEY